MFVQFHNPGITWAGLVGRTVQESPLDILLTNSNRYVFGKEWTDLSDHYVMRLECLLFDSICREKTRIQVKKWNFDEGSS